MSKTDDTGRLQQAWQNLTEPTTAGECPDDSRLFDAASGRLASNQVREVVLHTAHCGQCAQSWRVALELQRARGNVGRKPFRLRPVPVAWAAAAAIMLGLGVISMLPQFDPGTPAPGDRSIVRGIGVQTVDLLVPERAVLLADGFHLRWSEVPVASEYRVRVMDANLVEVFSGTTLETGIVLSRHDLEHLSDGDELYWYVIARLDDGSELRSVTRTAILARSEHEHRLDH